MDVAERTRDHVLAAHRDLVETVLDRADRAAADLSTPADRQVVTARLELALREADLLDALVGVIRSVADELGFELPAEPVPAPPYVVVTARGPMLRLTVDPGRLVVLLRAFERVADGYVRADADPAAAIEVTVHRTG